MKCSAISTSHFWHRRNLDNPDARIAVDNAACLLAEYSVQTTEMLWEKAMFYSRLGWEQSCAQYVRAALKRERKAR